MAEAGSKGCMECMGAVAGWGRRRVSAADIRKVEMDKVQQPNDGEGDHMSLIQQEEV
jgi:hypothetical protein